MAEEIAFNRQGNAFHQSHHSACGWRIRSAAFANAGFPPFAGFFSKDSIIEALHASTRAGSGNLVLAANRHVRTGTGSITIATGGELRLSGAGSTIYTAGERRDTGSFDAIFSEGLLQGDYLTGGGNIRIDAHDGVRGVASAYSLAHQRHPAAGACCGAAVHRI